MGKLIVIAFGGNALLRNGQKGTYAEQIQNVTETCDAILPLIKQGHNIVIGHGNGPQVGNALLQHEGGSSLFGIEPMPLDLCVAETQGSIGYLIEQGFVNALYNAGIKDKSIITVITRVCVDKNDPAFNKPIKPVGPYYSKEKADAYAKATGAIFAEDPKGNGWRKVVASPTPIKICNIDIIEKMAKEGKIVVTVGGGGISYIEDNGNSHGIESVIDKDLASALAGSLMKADAFYILTDVPKVYINFRKPNEKALDTITVNEAKQYLAEGHFTEGSMAPKVRAAIYFIENGGKECIITEASQMANPNGGTKIVKN